MSSQHPHFIQKQNYTESRVAFAQEILHCTDKPNCIFATPDYVLAGGQKVADIQVSSTASLNNAIESAKQQLQQADDHVLLMGGIPFNQVESMDLMLVEHVQRFQKLIFDRSYAGENKHCIKSAAFIPSGQQYQSQVEFLVDAMRQGQLNKAVLARVLELEFEHNIDVSALFYQLTQANPEGYSYAISSDPQNKGWFVGASPELLVGKKDQWVWSRPVAGTLPRHQDALQDKKQAEQLFASSKDQHEHAVVIEMIADHLSPLCKQLSIPKQPSLIKTQRLWHLATQIQGELKHGDTHVLDLVQQIHPTPAICGQPAPIAKQLITQLEPFQRELFAGAMGWADQRGNGEWSVTVRCARIQDQIARLFAGAGIVEASNPASEHAETAAKFRTVLDGFGLSPADLRSFTQ